MIKTLSLRWLLLIGAFSVVFMPLTPAQSRNLPAKDATSSANAETWTAEALSLLDRIKAGDSPALRAWLYSQTATWLAESREPALQQEALRVAIAGLADMKDHEREIPSTPAAVTRSRLLTVIKKISPETVEQAAQKYAPSPSDSDREKRPSLGVILRELDNPQKADQALAHASALIRSGNVTPQDMLGEMLRLQQQQPSALPALLSAVLDLAEGNPNAIPFHSWTFFSGLYMAETTPAQLKLRFWQVLVKTAQIRFNDLRSDQVEMSSAVRLFQRLLPEMQKQAPETYAEAASILASIAPASGSAKEYSAAEQRIKESIDPALQAKTEARAAKEKLQKRSLLELGSGLALRKGDLMTAAELLVEAKQVMDVAPENYTEAEAYLADIAQAAIEKKEVKVARFVIDHLDLPLKRVEVLHLLALYFTKIKDWQMTRETMDEAAKTLKDAAPSKDRAIAYFQLVADWRKVDESRARELMSDAVKATNNITLPDQDKQGAFSFSLWPLAEAVRRSFNDFAGGDKGGALSLSEDFKLKELVAAAQLGVYQSYNRPDANKR
jgi:hypothetical protein